MATFSLAMFLGSILTSGRRASPTFTPSKFKTVLAGTGFDSIYKTLFKIFNCF